MLSFFLCDLIENLCVASFSTERDLFLAAFASLTTRCGSRTCGNVIQDLLAEMKQISPIVLIVELIFPN